ncbi:hypothetical protein VTN49DRAFT_1674 [Thermomyces lanuginosus]|uniref:uncharacterized protein n=1 Tax=Thermomyces lanuginosus TaxID=5541 RepID=UPI0037437820
MWHIPGASRIMISNSSMTQCLVNLQLATPSTPTCFSSSKVGSRLVRRANDPTKPPSEGRLTPVVIHNTRI